MKAAHEVVTDLWGLCHILRHDGVDYGDYVEQISYLLLLKIADDRRIDLPQGASWERLLSADSDSLLQIYATILTALGNAVGALGEIYSDARSMFSNADSLNRMIRAIDSIDWNIDQHDLPGIIFEGLLEKSASEGKKGAGQYFTPRAVVECMVRCIQPDIREDPALTVADPATGTGGFLVAAFQWAQSTRALESDQLVQLRRTVLWGKELVSRVRRLALMNFFLHDLEPTITLGDSISGALPDKQFSIVLTNPPFGVRGGLGVPRRPDFVVSTTNKQLNFLQHVNTILKEAGRAAIVLPDNCFFAEQAAEVIGHLSTVNNLHTLLRLPNGTFAPYSAGTRTNVLFFTKGGGTERTWIYDARTGMPAISKGRPLTLEHFAEFETCYGDDPRGLSRRNESDSEEGRWRSFDIDEIRRARFNFDGMRWLGEAKIEETNPEALIEDAILDIDIASQELRGLLLLVTEWDTADD